MKNVLKLSALFMAVLGLSACGSGGDQVTGSSSITEQVAGIYSREEKAPTEDWIYRDTILVIRKDKNFEVGNHKWFFSKREQERGFYKVSGFQSFQGVYNEIDTTISHPQRGSLKIDINKGLLYIVDKPEKVYTKIK
ncbi:hypothetical protein AAKU52_002631 [Pedobacter sp. CG_S7]|uniref:hypothetical protein n=1 Tax=Pedobacter sp. CG_S7 TaxID=3143930 RepID=UPI00339207CF